MTPASFLQYSPSTASAQHSTAQLSVNNLKAWDLLGLRAGVTGSATMPFPQRSPHVLVPWLCFQQFQRQQHVADLQRMLEPQTPHLLLGWSWWWLSLWWLWCQSSSGGAWWQVLHCTRLPPLRVQTCASAHRCVEMAGGRCGMVRGKGHQAGAFKHVPNI